MRVLLAGASGAIGGALIPALTEAGHEVLATTRSEAKLPALAAVGATPLVLDILRRDDVMEVIGKARPDAVIHQATALSGSFNPKKFDETFAQTNRLRTVGTDNLLAAAESAGVSMLIAQSYTGWPNNRRGSAVKDENDPLDDESPAATRNTLAGIEHLEAAVRQAPNLTGIVLRYGSFYGPGTSLSANGDITTMVRKRRFPIVGGGGGVWSFLHIEDAAAATVAALKAADPGVFNIVDDEPAAVAVWLPYLASVLGAKPPRRVPTWMAKPLIGEAGIVAMTSIRGSSNAKAKHELGWAPRYASWREGFRTGLA